MKARVQRLVGAMALLLMATAILAGGAQADRPDNRSGMVGVGSIATQAPAPEVLERAVQRHADGLSLSVGTAPVPDAFERAVQRHADGLTLSMGTAPVPDAFERAVARLDESTAPDALERAMLRESSIAVRPDDRAGVRGPGLVQSTSPASSAVSGSDGFAWSGAAYGAGFTLGLVLLGGAAALLIRQRRGAILH